jgi:hypothetical protein
LVEGYLGYYFCWTKFCPIEKYFTATSITHIKSLG